MNNFYWTTIGNGNINLIIFNGLGLNSNIWSFITNELNIVFKLHLIDIPGIGENKHLNSMKIDYIMQILYNLIPKNSILLGWSIGGLIISKFALLYPDRLLGIISVASSPCFVRKKNWPGIEKNKLVNFFVNLHKNYYKTINYFFYLQTFNSSYSVEDSLLLKKILSFQFFPGQGILNYSFNILSTMDLRWDMTFLKVPLLRIYGSLDTLVPKKTALFLDKKWPNTQSVIINKAAHTPFLSHKKEFCSILIKFKNNFLI